MAFTNFTADGEVTNVCPSKSLVLVASGTWGSGTLTLSLLDVGTGTYVTVDSWTDNTATEIVLGAGSHYKLELASSTSPDINVIHKGAYEK